MGPRVLRIGTWPLAAALLLALMPAYADVTLFADDSILNIELHGPVAETIRDRKQRDERTFELRHADTAHAVSVRVRGKSRAEYCRFPPLRLNFQSAGADSVFTGIGKIKLVTHCRNSRSYDDNVLEEYAAYRMFAMLSDTSLRVRLMRIRYFDTDRPKATPVERYGFLIEPLDILSARVGGHSADASQVVKRRLNLEQAADVFVFHYLISNTDWSLVAAYEEEHCCHNGELLTIAEQDFVVPYDFDQAGLVNPPYARPDPDTGLRRVRMRQYRGYCIDELDLASAIGRVIELRPGIESMIRSLPFSNERLAGKHVNYLGAFFTAAADPSELAGEFESRCIG